MANGKAVLYAEVNALLDQEWMCIRTLLDSGKRVRTLLEKEAFDRIVQQLKSRGETVEQLSSLHTRLTDLLSRCRTFSVSEEWKSVFQQVARLNEALQTIDSLERENAEDLQKRSDEVEDHLQELSEGKRAIKGYARPAGASNLSEYRG
jgi:DNA repair exonuclease SbcCD ATPase subunit